MPEEVIFSSFDDKFGQFPLFSSLPTDTATKVCQQIVMSLMATVTTPPDPDTFEGESVIPLTEFQFICIAYYFYITSSTLPEAAFSFIAYLAPTERRNEVYTNINGLKEVLRGVKSQIRRSFVPESRMKSSTLAADLKLVLLGLKRPISQLLSRYRTVSSDFGGYSEFVQGVAVSFLAPQGTVAVEYAEGIEPEHVQKLSFRFLSVLLDKSVRESANHGEGILPVLDSNSMAFCYFFRLAFPSESMGVIQVFSDNRLALYRWAAVVSEEAQAISEIIAKNGMTTVAKKRLKRVLSSFETIAGAHLIRLAEKDSVQTGLEILLPNMWKYKNIEAVIEALITNQNIFLTETQSSADIAALATVLGIFAPHRDLLVIKESDYRRNLRGQIVIKENFDKDFEKRACIVSIEKKKVLSGTSGDYVKKLIKRWQRIPDIETLRSEVTKEIDEILSKVNALVAAVSLPEENETKLTIDRLITTLPDKQAFDVVKLLAINYNPVLAKFIREKAIYTIRADLWGI